MRSLKKSQIGFYKRLTSRNVQENYPWVPIPAKAYEMCHFFISFSNYFWKRIWIVVLVLISCSCKKKCFYDQPSFKISEGIQNQRPIFQLFFGCCDDMKKLYLRCSHLFKQFTIFFIHSSKGWSSIFSLEIKFAKAMAKFGSQAVIPSLSHWAAAFSSLFV